MLLHRTLTLTLSIPHLKTLIPRTMSIQLKSYAFAGNPLHATPALETLKSLLSASPQDSSVSPCSSFKILAFRNGRPLARTLDPVSDSAPGWQLGWIAPSNFKELEADSFVYLGAGEGGAVYWAVDVSAAAGVALGRGEDGMCFVELRTLMVATDWADDGAIGELAVVGHVDPKEFVHIPRSEYMEYALKPQVQSKVLDTRLPQDGVGIAGWNPMSSSRDHLNSYLREGLQNHLYQNEFSLFHHQPIPWIAPYPPSSSGGCGAHGQQSKEDIPRIAPYPPSSSGDDVPRIAPYPPSSSGGHGAHGQQSKDTA